MGLYIVFSSMGDVEMANLLKDQHSRAEMKRVFSKYERNTSPEFPKEG